MARIDRQAGRWLYVFGKNKDFPEPLAEIAFLAACAEEGRRAHLLLADRPRPPMTTARPGDEVVLCTRGHRALVKHGHAVVHAEAAAKAATPTDVGPLYGLLANRMFIELDRVCLHEAAVVSELDTSELTRLLRGQAFVKRLAPRRVVASAVPPSQAEDRAGRRGRFRVQSAPVRDTIVMGLDPTAGTWQSGMTSGPKEMPSVVLLVSADGRIEARESCVAWHTRNDDVWARVADVGAQTVAIDGPCATNGIRVLDDWSGWDVSARGGIRDAERELSRVGVGLYWTSYATVTRFDGASRWIARALKLFAEAAARENVDAVETHPHGAFRFFASTSTGLGLDPKSTPTGRAQRISLLQQFVGGLSSDVLKNHDAIDAACAALVAALHVVRETKGFGTSADGGVIWMPAVEPSRSPRVH